MDKTLQTRTNSTHVAFESLTGAAGLAPNAGAPACSTFVPVTGAAEIRFPPTRAAQASRSRGIFLGDSDGTGSLGHARWIEIPVALVALAVAAFALVVCFNATWLIGNPTVGANPGPAIVAAASVPPAFVEPHKLR